MSSRYKATRNLAPLVVVVLSFSGTATAGEVIYQTGFEPEEGFVKGLLDGQNDWGHSRVTNPEGAVVTDKFPADGTQCVRIIGDLTFQVPNMEFWFSGFRPTTIAFDPLANGTPLVTFQADVAFTGPPTGEDIYSTNLTAVDLDFMAISAMWLSSDGTIHCADGNDDLEINAGPLAFGTYYTLGMTLDYVNQTTDFYVNGAYVGTIAFATGTGNGFYSGSIEIDALKPPKGYDGYFDNYLITASAP